MTDDLIPDPCAQLVLGDRGEFHVGATYTGAKKPVWAAGTADVDTFLIRVTVTDGGTLPESDVLTVPGCHGSITDHDEQVPLVVQGEALCWQVLDDLLSAYREPDEYWSLAVGDVPGLHLAAGRDRVRAALNTVEYAQRHGAALEVHSDRIRAALGGG